jgi:hypothetical protein
MPCRDQSADGAQCSAKPVGANSQLLVVKRANSLWKIPDSKRKWRKSAFGTALEYGRGTARTKDDAGRSGRKTMTNGSKFQRNLIAVVASLLMSSVGVGAAVAPACVAANSVRVA